MERGSADNNYVALRNSSPRDLDRLIGEYQLTLITKIF